MATRRSWRLLRLCVNAGTGRIGTSMLTLTRWTMRPKSIPYLVRQSGP